MLKLKSLLIGVSLLPLSLILSGQSAAINTTGAAPDISSLLDIRSTTKGFLPPRMTAGQIASIASPADGLIVYNTTENELVAFASTTWTNFEQGLWSTDGDAHSSPLYYVGTSDNTPLIFRTSNTFSGGIDPTLRNTFFGFKAGLNNITGIRNVAIGASALQLSADGNNMVAIGDSALHAFSGSGNARNVAIGHSAGRHTTTGILNTFIGAQSGYKNTTGSYNTTIGIAALYSNTTGEHNIAVGNHALRSSITANENIAIGDSTMYSHISGNRNTVVGVRALVEGNNNDHSIYFGYQAGHSASNGSHNIGMGYRPLYNNNGGDENIAIGYMALEDNSSGEHNIGIGDRAMQNNLTASNNIAIGERAARMNASGEFNIAIGRVALQANETTDHNVAIGDSALYQLLSGPGENTAIGSRAGISTTTGNNNTFFGNEAGRANTTGDFNVAVGNRALFSTTGSDGNIAIGRNAGSDFNMGNNNVFIGALADASAGGFFRSVAIGHESTITASNQVRLGTTTTSSIGGYQPWTTVSDGRYKADVRQDVPGLEFIMLLNPVSYQVDVPALNALLNIEDQSDVAIERSTQLIRSGFIAQDVEQSAQQIGYDFSGVDAPKNGSDMYGLRYAEFVVPLIKALQEQQEELRLLEELNVELRSRIEAMK